MVAGSLGELTIEFMDPYGNVGAVSTTAQTISLATTSGTGVFYASAAGGTAITSVDIAAGQTERERLLLRHHRRQPHRDDHPMACSALLPTPRQKP